MTMRKRLAKHLDSNRPEGKRTYRMGRRPRVVVRSPRPRRRRRR